MPFKLQMSDQDYRQGSSKRLVSQPNAMLAVAIALIPALALMSPSVVLRGM